MLCSSYLLLTQILTVAEAITLSLLLFFTSLHFFFLFLLFLLLLLLFLLLLLLGQSAGKIYNTGCFKLCILCKATLGRTSRQMPRAVSGTRTNKRTYLFNSSAFSFHSSFTHPQQVYVDHYQLQIDYQLQKQYTKERKLVTETAGKQGILHRTTHDFLKQIKKIYLIYIYQKKKKKHIL